MFARTTTAYAVAHSPGNVASAAVSEWLPGLIAQFALSPHPNNGLSHHFTFSFQAWDGGGFKDAFGSDFSDAGTIDHAIQSGLSIFRAVADGPTEDCEFHPISFSIDSIKTRMRVEVVSPTDGVSLNPTDVSTDNGKLYLHTYTTNLEELTKVLEGSHVHTTEVVSDLSLAAGFSANGSLTRLNPINDDYVFCPAGSNSIILLNNHLTNTMRNLTSPVHNVYRGIGGLPFTNKNLSGCAAISVSVVLETIYEISTSDISVQEGQALYCYFNGGVADSHATANFVDSDSPASYSPIVNGVVFDHSLYVGVRIDKLTNRLISVESSGTIGSIPQTRHLVATNASDSVATSIHVLVGSINLACSTDAMAFLAQ